MGGVGPGDPNRAGGALIQRRALEVLAGAGLREEALEKAAGIKAPSRKVETLILIARAFVENNDPKMPWSRFFLATVSLFVAVVVKMTPPPPPTITQAPAKESIPPKPVRPAASDMSYTSMLRKMVSPEFTSLLSTRQLCEVTSEMLNALRQGERSTGPRSALHQPRPSLRLLQRISQEEILGVL